MHPSVLLCLVASATALDFSIGNWTGILTDDSGVLQSLKSVAESEVDFSPSDVFAQRNGVGNYHTGDITFRWRRQGEANWQDADSAQARATAPVSSQGDGALLASDFADVFPDTKDAVEITRQWLEQDGDLVLSAKFTAKNDTIELGAFGFPIEFNNIFTNRPPVETTAQCFVVDPYLGRDAGYLQVTRLSGTGPNLVVVPNSPDSKLEAYRFLQEDPSQPLGYQFVPFEGVYSFEMLSQAYAEQEWNATQPWNPPTSATISPGQSVTYSVRFALAPTLPEIETVLSSLGVPVAVGLPGYIIPSDMHASLNLLTNLDIASIQTEPADTLALTAKDGPAGYKSYDISNPKGSFGRIRVDVRYANGLFQTVHYWATTPASEAFQQLGGFLASKQWYTDSSDPFHRADSVLSYDYEADNYVLQDYRAWIPGISDEAGAGSFVAAAMKAAVLPDADEVVKLEQMVNTSVWGNLQANSGDQIYSVKKSLWFYEPDAVPGYQYDPTINSGTWPKNESYAVWRAYDYVWVSTLYYGLYLADRAAPGILKTQSRAWYLNQAFETVKATFALLPDGRPVTAYSDVGLMGETVWLEILQDLQAEGLSNAASELESIMRGRQQVWAGRPDPFGSEQPWDSTGQEAVYLWSKYFNDKETADKTANSVRGYMPTVAHWGWNGNARRYWDFGTAGKIDRVERMIHHYGSGLNAVPLLTDYRSNMDPASSTAFYDLRVAYGGHMGPLSNINADGFGACAFHSYPDTLKWDAYSGDYGPNALGHLRLAATYLVNHPTFGWVAFGGNVETEQDTVKVTPKDAVKRRIYVADLGLYAIFDAGTITSFSLSPSSNSVEIVLGDGEASGAPSAILRFEDTLGKGVKLTTPNLDEALGGHVVPIPGQISFSL